MSRKSPTSRRPAIANIILIKISRRFFAVSAVLCLGMCCRLFAAPTAEIDLLVYGDYIVAMDGADSVIRDGTVAVDEGRILAIGERSRIAKQYHGQKVLAGKDRIVLPGLINGHGHAAMTMLRGIADDLGLMDWLNNYIFPSEVRFVNEDFVRIGTELACWEMIRGGTTTFVDMYYFPNTIAEVVERCGMRAIITSTVINQKSSECENAQVGLQLARDFVVRWKGRSERIVPAIGPHALYTLTPELLVQVRDLAQELTVSVSIHLSESKFEITNSLERFDKTPVQVLDDLEFFRGPTIAAHMIWPTETEIPILATRGVGIIHNPSSNMKISSGIAPINPILSAGVAIGIGTDGAASNNDLDMWEEMRLAAFLQKVHTMDPTVLPASTVLRMATAGGAKAIGLGDEIGSLEVGKRADMIQVSLADLHLTPLYDVVSHLVYVADEQDVEAVVIGGKIVMQGKKVLTLDTDKIRAEASALALRIQAALNP